MRPVETSVQKTGGLDHDHVGAIRIMVVNQKRDTGASLSQVQRLAPRDNTCKVARQYCLRAISPVLPWFRDTVADAVAVRF
jgi:hypothetical protein